MNAENWDLKSNDYYGLFIVIISVITRIFIVSIAWSYGVFLVALKKTYPNSYYSELGWIAGLAQGFGSIISPSYRWLIHKIGFRLTFALGLTACFTSMLASSYTTSEHHLFLTYSLPFGIGSSIIFVTESILNGVYYPVSNRYHVSSSVAISLGFPLGYLILNPLTEYLIRYFEYDWQIVQRIYGMFALIQLIVFTPLFTDKYATQRNAGPAISQTNLNQFVWTNVYFLKSSHVMYLTRILWLVGLFSISCANNSVQINLNGFFESAGLGEQEKGSYFIAIGAADVCCRLVLAAWGRRFLNHLSLCFIAASLAGAFISLNWAAGVSYHGNIFICIIYGICPAVTMSLMYSVNSEIYGMHTEIDKNYTLNVMISGFGIFFGPIVTGYILDVTNKRYEVIYWLTAYLYLLAAVLFSLMKLLLVKNSENNERLDDYEAFENELVSSNF